MNTVTEPESPINTAAQAIWQVKPCPTWCTVQRHDDSDMVGDRIHHGKLHQVPLRLERAEQYTRGDWKLDYCQIYAEQHDEATVPSITLNRGELAGFRLTVAEAGQLAKELFGILANEVGYDFFDEAAALLGSAA